MDAADALLADPGVREHVAWARYEKGVALAELGRPDEAVAAFDDIVARYGDEPDLRRQVCLALVEKAVQLDCVEDEIAVYDEIDARFGDELELREEVVRALVDRSFALADLERVEEEIAGYDEVVARFGDAPEPAVRVQVVRALVTKGAQLGNSDRAEASVAVYDELVARYGDDPAVGVDVARALVNKSWRYAGWDGSTRDSRSVRTSWRASAPIAIPLCAPRSLGLGSHERRPSARPGASRKLWRRTANSLRATATIPTS